MSPDAHRLDAAGRRITRQQTSEFRKGTPPRNKGRVYPADPPTVEEIVAVMRQAGDHIYGLRMRGLIVVLWRSGMRIHEALLLHEPDLNRSDGSILVRRGKGGKRRIVGMDDWGWEQLDPWLEARLALPGIDSAEVVDAVHARRAPVISATSAIRDAGPPAQAMQAELAKRAPAARRAPAPRPEPTAPIVLPL
jgi:integrase